MAETKEHKLHKEKSAALKAIVEDLQRQQAEIQIRLNTAMGEWLQVEREVKRNEPLTASMKTVLRLLIQYNATITESDLYSGTRYWIETPPDCEAANTSINKSVFYGLLSREIIGDRKPSGALRYSYQVSEHGKALASKI